MIVASARYRFIVLGLLAGGLWAMYQARPSTWVVRPWETPMTTLLWITMLVVASISLIPLPRRRYGLSLITALDLGAFLVFGPAVAAWCAVTSRLVAISSDHWNPFSSSVGRIGSVALAFGIAGWVYQELGGNAGVPALATQADYIAALAAATAYLFVRTCTRGFFLTIRWGVPWAEVWKRELNVQVLFDIALFPFAILLALTQLHLGSMGVALFLVPLLLVRYSIKLWMDTRDAHLVTVRVLMEALDASDPFTRGVSRRVSQMSMRIARGMNLPAREIEELEYAALLHDVGRVSIRREILAKPEVLIPQGFNAVTSGPQVACDMIQNIGLFQGAAEIVLNHHERPDGKGYPRGLSGSAIPMGSRIIMVVSAFNAMISDRPYRRGRSQEEAIEELLVHTGTQFAPEVVETLIKLYSEGRLIEPTNNESQAEIDSRDLDSSLAPEKKESASFPKILELPFGVNLTNHGRGHMEVEASGKTDTGCVRTHNEDAILTRTLDDHSVLLAVADGMGGAKGGGVASSLAIEQIKKISKGKSQLLKTALEQANEIIHNRGSQDEKLQGMGTTATVAVINRGQLHIAHVGDSRAYLINAGGVNVLTRDHTLGVELRRSVNDSTGMRGMDHVLTRCLGGKPSVQVDSPIEPINLEAGDYVLLCSDGLTCVIEDDELKTLILEEKPSRACEILVELAIERGAPDNISVVIGQVS